MDVLHGFEILQMSSTQKKNGVQQAFRNTSQLHVYCIRVRMTLYKLLFNSFLGSSEFISLINAKQT